MLLIKTEDHDLLSCHEPYIMTCGGQSPDGDSIDKGIGLEKTYSLHQKTLQNTHLGQKKN